MPNHYYDADCILMRVSNPHQNVVVVVVMYFTGYSMVQIVVIFEFRIE